MVRLHEVVCTVPRRWHTDLNPASSTPVKMTRTAKGETPEDNFYYAYITLFGGHNRTPPTLHYHHHLSTHHPCLQNYIYFFNPPSSTTLKIAWAAKGELPEGAFYYAYITIEKGHNAVWWTQSYSPDPPLPPLPPLPPPPPPPPPIHTA